MYLITLKRKLSKPVLVLFFFIFTLLLSLAGLFLVTSIYHPTYTICATKFDTAPITYFSFDNPDRYALEAISNGSSSTFTSLDYTQIDELTQDNLTWNVEYSGNYYGISILCGDNFPPFLVPAVFLVGIAVSIVAIVAICFYWVGKWISHKCVEKEASMFHFSGSFK